MYKLQIYKLPKAKKNITIESDGTIFSQYPTQPLFSLGFHSFIHRTKDSMSITNKLQTKNKFYYVVNPFEHYINDYKNNLINVTKSYFNVDKSNEKILSRAFYKMWEILYLFDLINNKDINYAALAEGPGAFLQAVIKFKEKFYNGIKKDKIFAVTIHAEEGKNINIGKQFLNRYNKKYPDLINLHKTYPTKIANKFKSRDNGDITKIKTISLFKKDMTKQKRKADLITADGGFEWKDENYQEQEAYALILGEIIAALNVQQKGGHFVLKIFETFTNITLKLIYLLTYCYDECYIYKPFFSRLSNSEKYIICKGFNLKSPRKTIKNLEKILEQMNTENYLNTIFIDFELPNEFINIFQTINRDIANNQQIVINKIVKYIKGNNYFGEKYHEYKKKQIEATEFWINTFYPSSSKLFLEKKKELQTEIKEVLAKNIINRNKLKENYIYNS